MELTMDFFKTNIMNTELRVFVCLKQREEILLGELLNAYCNTREGTVAVTISGLEEVQLAVDNRYVSFDAQRILYAGPNQLSIAKVRCPAFFGVQGRTRVEALFPGITVTEV